MLSKLGPCSGHGHIAALSAPLSLLANLQVTTSSNSTPPNCATRVIMVLHGASWCFHPARVQGSSFQRVQWTRGMPASNPTPGSGTPLPALILPFTPLRSLERPTFRPLLLLFLQHLVLLLCHTRHGGPEGRGLRPRHRHTCVLAAGTRAGRSHVTSLAKGQSKTLENSLCNLVRILSTEQKLAFTCLPFPFGVVCLP